MLARHGLVVPRSRRRKRETYRRWERETPMALWQLDIVGGDLLLDEGFRDIIHRNTFGGLRRLRPSPRVGGRPGQFTTVEVMGDMVAWAFDLAGGKLAGVLPRRWAHVQGVARRSRLAAPLFSVEDSKLLVSAAFLHDIGYAPELAGTSFHPLDGARYLRGIGVSDRLVSLVAHHSCAVLEAELRGLSDELAQFEDEQTALRDALWWADMTTTSDGGETTVAERVAEIENRYGPDDLVSQFIRRAGDDLSAAVERTERRLEAAGIVQP